MAVQLTLTANAGVIIECDGCAVLIDALHDWKTQRFSSVSRASLAQIRKKFNDRHPDIVLTSHRHPDHCSEILHYQFSLLWPNTKFLYPEDFTDEQCTCRVGSVRVDAVVTLHEGEEFSDVRHTSYFVSVGGKGILFSGDAAMSECEALLALCGKRVPDIAIMNFPWITLASAREFLGTQIKPKQTVIVHLPFLADDTEHYRAAAFHAAEGHSDIHVLSEPMQSLVL